MKTFSEFQEGVASLVIKGGSKLLPTLMTGIAGIGAAGTIMQIRKKRRNKDKSGESDRSLEQRANAKKSQGAGGSPGQIYTGGKYNKQVKKSNKDTYIDPTTGKEYDIPEEVMAAPTNNIGGGQIAGTVEAGDDPPVKKKKPPIMARGKLPGARTRFKTGADFLTNLKKNKYT